MGGDYKNEIRVFISDDHAVFRRGLVDVCTQAGITVVGESGSAEDTLAHCFDNRPDVLIIDLNMDTTSGVQTVEDILEEYPNAQILVCSMRSSINTIRATYELGVRGYVTKSQGPEYVIDAVKRIASGRNYYMPGMAEDILEYSARNSQEVDPHEVLSEKELKIFRLISLGHTNEEIAREMDVTPKSIANRTLEIRNKLGIRLTSFEWIARKYNLLKLDL